jgi:hypothetical protein
MTLASPSRPQLRQVILGLFVLGQLVFILAANFLPLLQAALVKQSAPGSEAIGLVVEGTRYWGSWTGQLQGWSLFAPAVPKQSVFLAVELRWDDDPHWPAASGKRRVLLSSPFEPADRNSYFRPFGSFRVLGGYEAQLNLVALAWDAESHAADPEEWHRRFADAVRRDHPAMQAYLAWRLRRYREEHPEEATPRQVILVGRIYRMAPPEQPWSWSDPVEQPIARWRPWEKPAPGFLSIDAFNPVTRRFEPVPEESPHHE